MNTKHIHSLLFIFSILIFFLSCKTNSNKIIQFQNYKIVKVPPDSILYYSIDSFRQILNSKMNTIVGYLDSSMKHEWIFTFLKFQFNLNKEEKKNHTFFLILIVNREIRFVSLVLLNRHVFTRKKEKERKKGISGDMEKLVVSRSNLFQ